MNPISGLNVGTSAPLTFGNAVSSAVPNDVLTATGSGSGGFDVSNMIQLLTQMYQAQNASQPSAPLSFNNAVADTAVPADVQTATSSAGNSGNANGSEGSEGAGKSSGNKKNSGSEGAE